MVLAVSSGLMMLNIVILVLLIVWVGVWGLGAWRRRHYATVLSQEKFQAGLRRAQVIDLRPKDQFDRGHILGARSVPYALLRQQGVDLRADMPIYLYDDGVNPSGGVLEQARLQATVHLKGWLRSLGRED